MIHTQKKSGFHACANLKSRSSYSISRLISKLLLVRLVILVINVVSTEGAVAGAPLYTLPAGEGSKENPTWAHNKLPSGTHQPVLSRTHKPAHRRVFK